MKIAVIGTGIAGLAAAWGLADEHHVTVYEAASRLGGHSATVDVEVDGIRLAVDTGFIVYNELNYPNLTAFFAELGVASHASDMSFSVSVGHGRMEWAGDMQLWKLFAQPSNLLRPSFLAMLKEILRFNKISTRDHRMGLVGERTLGDYLTWRGFSLRFQTDYLTPMGAAIWSTAAERMLDFPAETFIAFFDNHRLLSWDRPIWRTVSGGSRRYVERIAQRLRGRIHLATPVRRVERTGLGVRITDGTGHVALYDQVILGTHADQALALMADATPAERVVLGAIPFADNDVWLHRDPGLMPKRKAAWAGWNYLAWPSETVAAERSAAVTYWMNRLQGLDRRVPLFVSLNPPRAPRDGTVLGRFTYAHPQLDRGALRAQKELPMLQGRGGLWFAGAWTGHGFHEDGLRSGMRVAEALGARYPWIKAPEAAPAPLLEAAE